MSKMKCPRWNVWNKMSKVKCLRLKVLENVEDERYNIHNEMSEMKCLRCNVWNVMSENV